MENFIESSSKVCPPGGNTYSKILLSRMPKITRSYNLFETNFKMWNTFMKHYQEKCEILTIDEEWHGISLLSKKQIYGPTWT